MPAPPMIAASGGVRRRWVAAVVVAWQLAESVLPREQVRPVRRLLLAMDVYGDALGLVLRSRGSGGGCWPDDGRRCPPLG